MKRHISKFSVSLLLMDAYLAISARLFASSAIWLSSVKLVRSLNILVSGACSPWRVLWAWAHFSSRSSFPKSFFLVKAICKTTNQMKHPASCSVQQQKLLQQLSSYPLFNDKIPSLSAQGVSGEELDKVQWNIEDKVVKPNHACPTPSNSFNRRKAPVCVNSYQCSNLFMKENWQIRNGSFFYIAHGSKNKPAVY